MTRMANKRICSYIATEGQWCPFTKGLAEPTGGNKSATLICKSKKEGGKLKKEGGNSRCGGDGREGC